MSTETSQFNKEAKKFSMKDKFELEENSLRAYAAINYMQIKLIDNLIYVVTDVGYWRITYLQKWDCFVVHHGNYIPKDVDPEKYVDADYHFQKNIRFVKKLMNILVYIKDHDDFRFHVMENVESMPRRTKKQRLRYNRVKQKQQEYKEAITMQMIRAFALANAS